MKKQQVFGILNITPDSFSDGGCFMNPDKALFHAKHLLNTGANIVDVGANSTRPHAKITSYNEEIARLTPIMKLLHKENIIVSLDTFYPEVAKWAIEEFNVKYINDVDGLKNPQMRQVFEWSIKFETKFIFMHSLTVPADKHIIMPQEDLDMANNIVLFAKNTIKDLQDYDRLIFDVGIGFGKNTRQSWFLLQNISLFSNLWCKVMVGHSRKSVIRDIFNVETCDIESLDFYTNLITKKYLQNIDYLRVHKP